jgi:hypothetical protein
MRTNSTLQELYNTAADFSAAFESAGIDVTTLGGIWECFSWREVCDDDYFSRFLSSVLLRVSQNYNDLLRVQLIQMDPLVTHYLEKQISGDSYTVLGSTRTGESETKRNADTSRGTVTSGEGGRSIKTDYGRSETNSGQNTDIRNGTVTDTVGGDGNVYEVREYDDRKRITEREATTADRNTSGSTGTGSTSASDTRSLSASIPIVDNYSADSFPSGAAVGTGFSVDSGGNVSRTSTAAGMESTGMDWRNADAQNETASSSDSTSVTRTATSVTVDGKDTSRESSWSAEGQFYTQTKGERGKTEYKNLEDVHKLGGRVDYGGTDTVTETNNSHGETTDTGTTSENVTGTTNETANSTATGKTQDRSIETGRDGSPAELIEKAKRVVASTGAFAWLCRKVDVCFVDIYDF